MSSTKKSSAFVHVVSASNPNESTATPPSSLSSSSSPDAGGGPLRIVSRSSTPSSLPPTTIITTTQSTTKPTTTQISTSVATATSVSASSTLSSSSLPPPPPLHPQIPPPPSLAPTTSFGHAPVVGSSNPIIIHSQNLNPFPFVAPASQYGLLASPLNAAGQPQTIIVNQCGQPVGFVSPTNFYNPQPPPGSSSAASVATCSGSNASAASGGSSYPRPPVLMACRAAPPAVLGPQSLSTNAGSTNLPLFPTQMYPTAAYALPFSGYNNSSLLLSTGQFVCKTPQGQLIGFQIPTNVTQQPIPVDPQSIGGGKLQPVLPKPGSIFPLGGASSAKSGSKATVTTIPPQMTPLAPTLVAHSSLPIITSTSSLPPSNVVIKHDPETPVVLNSGNITVDQSGLGAVPKLVHNSNLPTPSPATKNIGLLQPCPPLDTSSVSVAIPEVVDLKNELTAAEIHRMFLQEVENIPAADRPQVLTHFIDGFVIQESLEPFPLSPIIFDEFPMLIQPTNNGLDWSAPPQLSPEDRMTPPPVSAVPDTRCRASICLRCERDLTSGNRYESEPNFCSKNCYKSYQRRRANSDTSSSAHEFKNKRSKSGKRQKFDDATPQITTPSTTSSPKRITDTPSELPSTSNSFTLEEPSPPLVSDKNPADWTVDDVHAWLLSLGPGVAQYVTLFRQQEIDGQALLLLQEDHLVRQMGLKLGPAVKICAALKNLRS